MCKQTQPCQMPSLRLNLIGGVKEEQMAEGRRDLGKTKQATFVHPAH